MQGRQVNTGFYCLHCINRYPVVATVQSMSLQCNQSSTDCCLSYHVKILFYACFPLWLHNGQSSDEDLKRALWSSTNETWQRYVCSIEKQHDWNKEKEERTSHLFGWWTWQRYVCSIEEQQDLQHIIQTKKKAHITFFWMIMSTSPPMCTLVHIFYPSC